MFPLLKKFLKVRRYEDRSALSASIHQCLNDLSKDDFTAAIQQLPERWQKCISVDTLRKRTYMIKRSVFPSFEIKSFREPFERTM